MLHVKEENTRWIIKLLKLLYLEAYSKENVWTNALAQLLLQGIVQKLY